MAGKAQTLADLGGWPEIKISPRSHATIRRAYDQVVTACARLASFATGGTTRTAHTVDERQEALAVDDLVAFAIHGRRLIESTGTRQRFSRIAIRSPNKKIVGHLRVLTVISTIVHHVDIEIIRTQHKLNVLRGTRYSIEELMTLRDSDLPASVVVRSDKDKIIGFELRELIETFQEQILEPIVDLCDEQGFCLTED